MEDCWQTEIIGGFAKWFSVFLRKVPVCLCYTASSSSSFCLHRIRIQCWKKPISEGLSMVIQIPSSFSFGSSFFWGFIQQKAASHIFSLVGHGAETRNISLNRWTVISAKALKNRKDRNEFSYEVRSRNGISFNVGSWWEGRVLNRQVKAHVGNEGFRISIV